MEITTEMIKELREATKAGVLDCRKALEAADGDFQKAVDFLREKGMATAAKRADRQASNGDGGTVLARRWTRGCDGGSQLRNRFCRPLGAIPQVCP